MRTAVWLGRQDSNLGMAESKSAALPLGYAPTGTGEPRRSDFVRGGRTIAARPCPINVRKPHIIYVARVDPPCPGTKLASHDLPRAGRRYRIHPQARCRPEGCAGGRTLWRSRRRDGQLRHCGGRALRQHRIDRLLVEVAIEPLGQRGFQAGSVLEAEGNIGNGSAITRARLI